MLIDELTNTGHSTQAAKPANYSLQARNGLFSKLNQILMGAA
jgi:hypothetical protein